MQIFGPFRVTATPSSNGPNRLEAKQPSEKPAPVRSTTPVDQLDLSSAATGANRISDAAQVSGGGEMRIDRVAEIRRQIADGRYETAEKLDAALDRLLDQLA